MPWHAALTLTDHLVARLVMTQDGGRGLAAEISARPDAVSSPTLAEVDFSDMPPARIEEVVLTGETTADRAKAFTEHPGGRGGPAASSPAASNRSVAGDNPRRALLTELSPRQPYLLREPPTRLASLLRVAACSRKRAT